MVRKWVGGEKVGGWWGNWWVVRKWVGCEEEGGW